MARPKSKKITVTSGGLGSDVENVIEATGIKKLFHIFVEGKDCNCEGRKKKLNELFPYKFKARCLTEGEYNGWKHFREVRTLKMNWEQVVYVCDLYAGVFSRQKWHPDCINCSGTVKTLIGMIDKIDKVFDSYENELA